LYSSGSAVFTPEDGDYVSPKRWYLTTNPHGITTQKSNIDIFTAVRTSNLTQYSFCLKMFLTYKYDTGMKKNFWVSLPNSMTETK
jgi:hypothetical protein